MSSLSRLTLVVLLLTCATARNLVRGADPPSSQTAPPILPHTVDDEAGRVLPLGPSERVLAGAPGVLVARRAYGATQVALVSTTGIREVHPPEVCLRSMGLEVVQRSEERFPQGCVIHLVVQGGTGLRGHFLHTYLGGGDGAGCGFWGRTGSAALARLAGRSMRWSTLQVMDRDPRRARRILDRLLTDINTRRER